MIAAHLSDPSWTSQHVLATVAIVLASLFAYIAIGSTIYRVVEDPTWEPLDLLGSIFWPVLAPLYVALVFFRAAANFVPACATAAKWLVGKFKRDKLPRAVACQTKKFK